MIEWRQVNGWPYEVNNLGQVRHVRRRQILEPGQAGYLKVNLWPASPARQAKARSVAVHVLVAEAFLGPAPAGCQVNHKDLNKHNNHISNLEYVTPLGNMRHRIENGQAMIGERNGLAKLTERDVLEARRLNAEGRSIRSLARQFNLTEGGMRDVVTGKNWKHLPILWHRENKQ